MKAYIDLALADRECRICKGAILKGTHHIRIKGGNFKQMSINNICTQCCPINRLNNRKTEK